MPSTRTQRETKTIRSPNAQARSEENIKPPRSRSRHEKQFITRTSEKRNEREENSRETAEDPDFDEYYDVEGKDKDENEDEESRAVLNKKASTYACTQASSPMGKPALQRSYREDSTRMYSAVRLAGQQ